jgi:terminase small subunit-like protein
MPHHDAIYDEMRRSPSFADAIAWARAESAHGLAMQVLEIADAAAPGDNPQVVKNRCDQRRWLAGKYNALYSDKLAVTDSDGGSIATRLAKMSAAERTAWAAEVAAPARALLGPPTIDHEDR